LQVVDPTIQKLFCKDVIELNTENYIPRIDPVHSHVRTCEYIAGVLILEGNKTFGRNDTKKRLLYKCIPDDHRLPVFLVPYELRIGFSKVYTNKFVTFRFDHWNDKHPRGILIETLGDVDNLEAFYEYQLYCKNLHVSMTNFVNKTRTILNKKANEEFVEQIFQNAQFQIEDRRSHYVFTVDPAGSLDYDDGFGVERVGNHWRVSIYIANVFVWLETLGLWNSFSKRVATIYLPDRRRPMLPTILSDILCSLQQDQPRFALAMDILVSDDGLLLEDQSITYKNVLICVNRNYSYEDPKMVNNDGKYKQLFEISCLMDNSIRNSHDIVAHWMVQMNTFTGILLADRRIGIFRSAAYLNTDIDATIKREDLVNLNDETVRIIKSWNNTIGQYVAFNDDIDFHHSFIKNNVTKNNYAAFRKNGQSTKSINMYIHITSPIRRLVDLLNQIILFDEFKLVMGMSEDARKFLDNWIVQMEYINTSMRYIRKIQTSCELLTHFFKNPDIMKNKHRGVVFDKIVKNDGFITYMVYLEGLKLLSRITTQVDVPNYSYHYFNMFLFEDEDKIKKKIRLEIVVDKIE
jgi:exoribonuclease R